MPVVVRYVSLGIPSLVIVQMPVLIRSMASIMCARSAVPRSIRRLSARRRRGDDGRARGG
eukprot:4188026-Amphidinium_carterae.3